MPPMQEQLAVAMTGSVFRDSFILSVTASRFLARQSIRLLHYVRNDEIYV
jgi:hypothetical protein